jgi:uncharacterized protein (TIGR02996 family)
MTECDALLAAVCAAPDDDLPRLVFADWCDENGEEDRAEFIRVQVELTKGVIGKKRVALLKREQELLKEHRAAWTDNIREFTDDFRDEPIRFRRGFVEDISINDELLERHGDELFRRAPIRTLRMGDQDGFNDLHKCKHLLRITTLDLTVSRLDSTGGSPALFRSKYLANLTTLIARGHDDNGHLNAEALEGIVTSKYLSKLGRLDIGHNFMFDNTLSDDFSRETEYLLALGNLPALTELMLNGLGMGDVAATLASRPWMSRITQLDLRSNYISDAVAQALAESPHLESIRWLDLRENIVFGEDSDSVSRLSPEVKRLLKRRFGKRVLLDE